MRSVATAGFWRRLDDLPAEVREQADKAYEQWSADPRHPSLHYKALRGKDAIFSVRVGAHYRAMARVREDFTEWIWIGSHADYDVAVRRL